MHSKPSIRDDSITGHFIAAPIKLSGKDYIAIVLVRPDKTMNRMYVHEVVLRKKLQQSAFKTEASTATEGALNGANTGAISSVLAKIYSVNPVKRVIKAEQEGNKTIIGMGRQVDRTQPDLSQSVAPGKSWRLWPSAVFRIRIPSAFIMPSADS